MKFLDTCLGASVSLLLLAGRIAAQNPPSTPVDFDFSISYSGSSISGRLVGLNLDANGNGTEVDPTSVLLFHLPTVVGLSASPSQPYVFVPHTFERSTYFSGTLTSTTPGVLGFQVSNYTITAAAQNLLMIDAGNDVTLVFNFGASLSPEGGVATYGIQAEEDALWPAVNTFVSYTKVTPPTWTALGSGLAGVSGIPSLTGTGVLSTGSSNSIDLTSAKPSSPATLLFGLSQLNAPFKGGVMVPNPLLLIFLGTNGAGELHLPFVMPAVPADVPLYFQFWIQDAAGVAGYAASNGLKGVTS